MAQLLEYIEQVEKMWLSLRAGQYADLIKRDANKRTEIVDKALPTDLSSKLTHQITQVTVFYQMHQQKEGFRLPTKRCYQVARLAK